LERKKIILLATSDINYDQRLQKVSNSLASFGADVLLVGRALTTSVPLQKSSFQQHRVSCFFNKGALFYLEINSRFFFLLMRGKADIVCANDADTLLAVGLASYFKSFELIYDSHEYFTEVPELQSKKVKKAVWSFIERWGIRKSKARYTVNESLASLFSEQHQTKFEVIMNVPFSSSQKIPRAKENILLYQGALNQGRGLECLIKAMVKIDGKLLIAGKGDLQEELLQMVEDLNLRHKVTFLGNLLPEELKIQTLKAKIGINILESHSLNYYYSLANKFFDYMHAGVPSLNMNFPEYQNINDNFEIAMLITSLEESQIVSAVHELLTDQLLYNKLKENCLLAREIYHWEIEAQKLKVIYQL
jgi:glycosyltransferase involved in cell wall biosynthesis